MQTRPVSIISFLNTPFDDPHFDRLLGQFANNHPCELEAWRNIERELFERRPDPNKQRVYRGYPDQLLMTFCRRFLGSRLPDGVGEAGAHHAWQVLRGRILRALLEEEPRLNPAAGKVLITDPRTCSDVELTSVVDAFRSAQPTTWTEWQRIETEGRFDDDPLRSVSIAFRKFLEAHCWIQSSMAISSTFLAVRGLFFWPA